jgi:hypothetical protein
MIANTPLEIARQEFFDEISSVTGAPKEVCCEILKQANYPENEPLFFMPFYLGITTALLLVSPGKSLTLKRKFENVISEQNKLEESKE